MKFNEIDYTRFIKSFNGNITPFPKVGVRPLGRVIYLRHDIDAKLDHSVMMAQIEADMGIKSTYFVLNTAEYFKQDISKELDIIKACGHEIGWHNSAMETWYLDGMVKPIRFYVESPLSVLRNRYGCNVRGTAAHYVARPNDQTFRNYNIWKLNWQSKSQIPVETFTLEEFGLEYEAYVLHRDIYLCDSGKQWSINPIETAKTFNGKQDCIIQILIHPQWWY